MCIKIPTAPAALILHPFIVGNGENLLHSKKKNEGTPEITTEDVLAFSLTPPMMDVFFVTY